MKDGSRNPMHENKKNMYDEELLEFSENEESSDFDDIDEDRPTLLAINKKFKKEMKKNEETLLKKETGLIYLVILFMIQIIKN